MNIKKLAFYCFLLLSIHGNLTVEPADNKPVVCQWLYYWKITIFISSSRCLQTMLMSIMPSPMTKGGTPWRWWNISSSMESPDYQGRRISSLSSQRRHVSLHCRPWNLKICLPTHNLSERLSGECAGSSNNIRPSRITTTLFIIILIIAAKKHPSLHHLFPFCVFKPSIFYHLLFFNSLTLCIENRNWRNSSFLL